MYYPANKIKTNLLASKGELIFKESKDPYEGPYWVTYRGEIFSGEGPNQKPNYELDRSPKNMISPNETKTTIVCEDSVYIKIKDIKIDGSRLNPPPSVTLPTSEDYKNRGFRRFFLRRINDNSCYEVKKDIFSKVKSRDSNYAFEMFEPISIDWLIYGPKNKIYEINYQTVINYAGLDKIHSNYNKYYLFPSSEDLFTSGGEFYSFDKKDYVGYYHIDEKDGFISGAKIGISPKIFPVSYDVEDDIILRILSS